MHKALALLDGSITFTETELGILRYARRWPGKSRTEIAAALNISKPMLTKAVGKFASLDLVSEDRVQLREGERGQPPVSVALRPEAFRSIGIHVNLRQVAIVSSDLAGIVLSARSYDLNSDFTSASIAPILNDIQAMIDNSTIPVLGIGLAVPAIVTENGELFEVTPAQRTLPYGEMARQLGSSLSLPVYLDNGAYCMANYEAHRPQSESKCLLYVTLDFGVGGGLAWNNQVFRGAFNQAANIGSLTPETGPRPNLIDLAQYLGRPLQQLTLEELERLKSIKDVALLEWINDRGALLSNSFSVAVQLYNPDTIVVGGFFPASILEALVSQINLDVHDIPGRRPLTKPKIRVTPLIGALGLAEAAALLPVSARLLGEKAVRFQV
ncbi:ROK family transcriptional regulator [Phyllobacterium sp. 628]|uniref:ROK family transcriptional regulator n=1 Tax=Phyllobacterium sp. 628 TaxID=2718938 RepID=UPI00166281DE|nr:ROK family transcriptional regulator [Phyllobacterium sp. 628]QND51308.1 ROK family transcriptional regulator [Phyllobacterium sp. 628]